MENLRLDGYRSWLERAIRIDDHHDWTAHTVDYSSFKHKLRQFSKRRAKIRRLLGKSRNDSIDATELDAIMGPAPQLPANYSANESKFLLPTPRAAGRTSKPMSVLANSSMDTDAVSYVPFPEEVDEEYHQTLPMDNRIRTDEGKKQILDTSHPFEIDTSLTPRQNSFQSVRRRPRTASASFWMRLAGPTRIKRQAAMRQVSNYERNAIVVFLAIELDNVAMFYLAQWQALSQRLLNFQNRKEHQNQDIKGAAAEDISVLQALGRELLELEALIVINLVTVRQILIRYDAFVRTTFEGTPMSNYYMKMMMGGTGGSEEGGAPSSSLRKLMQHAEIQALAETYEVTWESLKPSEAVENMDERHLEIRTIRKRFLEQREEFQLVLESSERAQVMASSGHAAPLQDTFLQNLRYYFLLGMVEDRLGYEPTYLVSRGTSLIEEMQIMADWRNENHHEYHREIAKDLIHKGTTGGGEDIGGATTQSFQTIEGSIAASIGHQQVFNLFMTLMAAFLYCMNYYIVEPSSTMYVNYLGGQDALSGALIGMMPLASFMSAIAYSIWTNHSFRRPFLVSCILMLTGNVMYSTAYKYKSLPMAFLGRFLTGLGGPKCIVRRYMADTTSLSIRTSVNAGFGMVVAAGSAFGPGCAIILNRLNFGIHIPWTGGTEITLNGMTGPGYFMAFLWSIFTLALFADFREPRRTGLEEQKKLEESAYPEQDIEEDAEDFRPNSELNLDSAVEEEKLCDQALQDVASPSPRGHKVNRIKSMRSDDELMTNSSVLTGLYETDTWKVSDQNDTQNTELGKNETPGRAPRWYKEGQRFFLLVNFPVRICLALLFAKVFVIETLVSSTSSLSKNRYQWQVREVGMLGCVNGFFVIPLSIIVGRLSMSYQDRVLMICLLAIGLCGFFNLIDITDLASEDSFRFNDDNGFSVGPKRYVIGYFITYMSIQSFEGIIGSALSKLIPTALASGTFNSGLLATLVDTFGRSCGDLFICLCGFINMRQLMNLLFIPGAMVLIACLTMVRKYYDLLAV